MENSDAYAVVIVQLDAADGGGFYGFVPDLPGCASDGATRSEALANTTDAIDEWIAEQTRRGQNIPAPGTAIAAASLREDRLLDALRALAEYRETAEMEIGQLKRQLAELIAVLRDDSTRPQRGFGLLSTDVATRRKGAH